MPAEKSSADLPLKLSAADRVAVIAGSGGLPLAVATTLRENGRTPFVVVVGGEGDPQQFAAFPHTRMTLEDFPDLIAVLRREKITHAVLAGAVSRRPNPWKVRRNLQLLRILAKFIAPLARGDDNLLRAVVDYIEENGIRIVGAHEIAPDLLAPSGLVTAAAPLAGDWRDIDAGRAAATAIGILDIGQAAVAIGGRAVALEDIEGTDELLARVKAFRGHGRLAGKRRGVLVKCAKPRQELRADLPTIGPVTVEAAHEAGLAGIAVDAGRSFLLEQRRTAERADALGLFIVGLEPERK